MVTEFIERDRDWADQLWARLRDGGWTFEGYYKYSFSFKSKIDPSVTVSFGGMAEDIYEEDVRAEMDFSNTSLARFNGIYRTTPEGIECYTWGTGW
jgi:hypothetical protein